MSEGAFTLEKLREAMQAMDAIKPIRGWAKPMTLSPSLAERLGQKSHQPHANLWGVPVHVSSAFPHQFACPDCSGTGHGEMRTFCERCAGAGEIRLEGYAADDRGTVMFVGKLPRKAYVKWPSDVEVPLRPLEAHPDSDRSRNGGDAASGSVHESAGRRHRHNSIATQR